MKAMSKQQLAACAGVSVRTLMRWCATIQTDLEALGMRPNMKVLPPNIVNFIAKNFSITIR